MKKILAFGIIAFTIFSCQQPNKIAFVDSTELVNEYQEKKDLEAKFKAKIEAYTKKRDSVSKAFQIEAQEFQLKAQKMSQNSAQKRYEELGQKQQLLQQQFQLEEQSISQQSQQENDSLLKRVKDFVEDYGKRNGYDYILGKNEFVGTVYFGKEETDITKKVLEELNKSYEKK